MDNKLANKTTFANFHVFIAFISLLLETLSLYRFSQYYATDFLFILLIYNIFLPNERFRFANYSIP